MYHCAFNHYVCGARNPHQSAVDLFSHLKPAVPNFQTQAFYDNTNGRTCENTNEYRADPIARNQPIEHRTPEIPVTYSSITEYVLS